MKEDKINKENKKKTTGHSQNNEGSLFSTTLRQTEENLSFSLSPEKLYFYHEYDDPTDPRGQKYWESYAGSHNLSITILAPLPNQAFLSASKDSTIRQWQLNNIKELPLIYRRGEYCFSSFTALAVLLNGTHFLSGSDDGVICLWRVGKTEPLKTFQGSTEPVKALAILHDGIFLAGSEDGTIYFSNIEREKPIQCFKGAKNPVLAILTTKTFLVGGETGTICLWDAGKTLPLQKFTGSTKPVTALAILRDGMFLAGYQDGGIYLFKTGEEKPRLEFKKHGKSITALTLLKSKVDQTFVSVDEDGIMIQWSIEAGICLSVFMKDKNAPAYNFSCCVIFPNGIFLAPTQLPQQDKYGIHIMNIKPVIPQKRNSEKYWLELFDVLLTVKIPHLITLNLPNVDLKDKIFNKLLDILPHLINLETLNICCESLTNAQLEKLIGYCESFNNTPFNKIGNFFKKISSKPTKNLGGNSIQQILIIEDNFNPTLVNKLKNSLENGNGRITEVSPNDKSVLIKPYNRPQARAQARPTAAMLYQQLTNQEMIQKILNEETEQKKNPKEYKELDDRLLKIIDKPMVIELGQDSLGVVYKGIDSQESEYVAIKKLSNQYSTKVIRKELNCLMQLNHNNNFTAFRGVSCINGVEMIVMEFHESLHNILYDQKKELKSDIKLRIALHIAQGIYYLHQQKMIHTAISSRNISINPLFQAKITTFALLNKTEEKVNVDLLPLDTVHYMALELFAENPSYSDASDIYAFSILLWAIFTREKPFKEATTWQEVKKQKENNLDDSILMKTPQTKRIAGLISLGCMSVPEKRLSAKKMAQALQEEQEPELKMN